MSSATAWSKRGKVCSPRHDPRVSNNHRNLIVRGVRQQLARVAFALRVAPFLGLVAACGSPAKSTSPALAGGGGSTLNLPESGCADAGIPEPVVAGPCVSTQARSFTRDIVPLFDSCAGEICHAFAGGAIASQIHLLASECCDQRQMIEPFHPERSYVLQKLRGENLCSGWQMPLDRQPLSAPDLQSVADWICQGATTSP